TFFFFFQAEDGIRDFHVTGVQTCALPISAHAGVSALGDDDRRDDRAVAPLHAVLSRTATGFPGGALQSSPPRGRGVVRRPADKDRRDRKPLPCRRGSGRPVSSAAYPVHW